MINKSGNQNRKVRGGGKTPPSCCGCQIGKCDTRRCSCFSKRGRCVKSCSCGCQKKKVSK